EAVHVPAALVDDGVERDGGLAGLPIADDELALAAADGDHRVDRLDAGLERLLHRLADDDTGGLQLDAAGGGRLDGPLAVDGLAEGAHDAPEEGLAHRGLGDTARAPGAVALLALLRLSPYGGPDGAFLECGRGTSE